ncbi:dopaminechrome tautomerase [Bemisia tabaci]|uniref:dopaminechrome tautomerase n=1 Tax=Bemisia tabaci TaxID=7038 RepID=UPI003B28BB3C
MVHNVVCKEKPTSHTCAKIKKRTFVTSPRVNRGIPVVLSTISDRVRNGQHLLKPFPDWHYNREGNCDGLTSVFRTQIDECGRLWVLDAGVVDSFAERPRRICPPQILVFDLNAGDKLLGRYPLPKNLLESDSLLITIVVDVRDGQCKDAFAYMADVVGFKLLVFDLRREAYHRVAHNTFYPYPDHGDFNVAGTSFQLMDGLFALTLGPVELDDRRLYYHSFASVREGWVMTSTLKDRAAFLKNERSHPTSFFTFAKERVAQSGPEAMNKEGVLFFSQVTLNAVACWNSKLEFKPENLPVVAKNDVTMQFPSGLKAINDEIYVMSSRLQKYLDGSLANNEINFRVLRGSQPALIQGSVCDTSDYWTDYVNYDTYDLFGPDSLGPGPGVLDSNSLEQLTPYNPLEDRPLSLSNYSSTPLHRPPPPSKCDYARDPTCLLKPQPFKYSKGFKFYKKPAIAYAAGGIEPLPLLDDSHENRTKIGSSATHVIYYNPIAVRYPESFEEPPLEFGSRVAPGKDRLRGDEEPPISPPIPPFKNLQFYPARPPFYEYAINHPASGFGPPSIPKFPRKSRGRPPGVLRSPFSRVRFTRLSKKR